MWNAQAGQGIAWTADAGLDSKSSPVVWGGRVFLTGANKTSRKVYAYDTKTGQRLWESDLPPVKPSSSTVPEISEDTGYAASTPATDGRRVYAIFANGDIGAFDYQGKALWARALGIPESQYGFAASLVLWRDRVIVQFDQAGPDDGKSRLLALDSATGDTAWEVTRPVGGSWASPIVTRPDAGEQVVASANPWVIAYNPSDGAEMWKAECMSGDVAPSPTAAGAMVYAVNQGACLAAIRTDGFGAVTGTHIAWKATDGLPDVTSPATDGRCVWLLTSGGTVTCYDAKDGRKLWEKELNSSFSSSPTVAGSRVYAVAEDGKAFVFEAAAEYKEVGTAELGEKVYASPAFADGRIYIRGSKHLFCVGVQKP